MFYNLDNRRKSSSMHEILNWGPNNGPCTKSERPKRLQLSIIGNEINIDDPPPPPQQLQQHHQSHSTPTTTNFHYNYKKPGMGWSWFYLLSLIYSRSHVMSPYVRSRLDICMEWRFLTVFCFCLLNSAWMLMIFVFRWKIDMMKCESFLVFYLTFGIGRRSSDRRATNLSSRRVIAYTQSIRLSSQIGDDAFVTPLRILDSKPRAFVTSLLFEEFGRECLVFYYKLRKL